MQLHKLYVDDERFNMIRILINGLKESVKKVKPIKDKKTLKLKERLTVARAEALKRIFDTQKYPDDLKKAPEDGGQSWVSEAVSDVKSIWVNEELGRIETQLEKLSKRYIALFHLIDKTYKYYKEAEFKLQINQITMDKVGKALFDEVYDTEETSEQKEQRLLNEINYYRQMLGLNPLKLDKKLRRIADGHAAHMQRVKVAASRIQGHPFGETFKERLAKGNYKNKNVREIISDKDDVKKILISFQTDAKKHRNVLMPEYKYIGVGIEGKYCCVIVAGK